MTFFQETAEVVLGRSADEIGQMRESVGGINKTYYLFIWKHL